MNIHEIIQLNKATQADLDIIRIMEASRQKSNHAPHILYHGSGEDIHEPFRPFSHFGTRRAALQRAASVGIRANNLYLGKDQGWHLNVDAQILIYSVHVNIRNALRVRDMPGVVKSHTPERIADLLHYTMRKISADERDQVLRADGKGYDVLASILENQGYDGLVYRNNHEDLGNDSWIIIKSEQASIGEPEKMSLGDAMKELGIAQ